MARLPKKYIKKYGGITKRAWSAFKRKTLSGGTSGGTATATTGKRRKRRTTSKKRLLSTIRSGGTTMAKRRRKRATTKRRYTPRRAVSVRVGARRRRRTGILSNRTANVLMNGAAVGTGAVGSTWLINMVPFVRDLSPWVKALIQAGGGVVGITMFRNVWGKKLASGAIVGSAISLLLPYMPESFKFSGARQFSAAELDEVRTGVPYSITPSPAASMGVPFTISGRGSRNYAGGY